MPVPVAVEEDRVVPVDMERDQVVLVAVEEDQVVPVAMEEDQVVLVVVEQDQVVPMAVEDQVVQVVVEENETLDAKYRAIGVIKDPTVINDQALIALKKINRAMQSKCIRACCVE